MTKSSAEVVLDVTALTKQFGGLTAVKIGRAHV